jgi:lipopolysaccharide transport system ATP-binding protein
MGADIAIAVRDLSKRYRLYRSPLDRLLEALPGMRKQRHADFWALRGISFDVPRGATVGILGRNGSGKSTLLQILFSFLQPTTGSVTTTGKVSALLELGAGFNPAFTGRANVLLHGATLGLSRREINERLPRIEEFAEIGAFIDQPVKSYSSGMFVRLAFAAALSDDPDILIVDEALAVGDAKFQQKCYNKFLEFQKAGKTVLLVTHDTQAVVKHCHHALLLENGHLVGSGAPNEVVNRYYELLFTGSIGGFRPVPVRVRQGYKGFSIVHYETKHYALAEEIGSFDLAKASADELARLTSENKCAIGDSLQEVKVLVDRIAVARDGSQANPWHAGVASDEILRSPLDEFLAEDPDAERCPRRPSYNKNEHRFGDRRGEIIDYFVVCAEDYNTATVDTGDVIDIYLKARFHEPIALPLVGLAVKTVDGVLLYGTNTRMQNLPTRAAEAGAVQVFKFSLRLSLPPGDVFLDLGLAEKAPTEDNPLDIRYDLIHLHVHGRKQFAGLVNLDAELHEVVRADGSPLCREWALGS